MTAVACECEQVVEAPRRSDFVFIDELCQRLGCSESTAGRWVRRGLIPAPLKGYAGVRLAWRRTDLETYLAALA